MVCMLDFFCIFAVVIPIFIRTQHTHVRVALFQALGECIERCNNNTMKQFFRKIFEPIKRWISGMSFRTGVIYLIVCAVLYIISFAQIMLPISASTKTILWIVFFGLAKIAQYIGLAIVGAEGWRRIKAAMKRTKARDEEKKNN